tara:strand:+ start:1641 stop:1793 length:153 start_codon:yes stop_codon:yes gene_type:complete
MKYFIEGVITALCIALGLLPLYYEVLEIETGWLIAWSITFFSLPLALKTK